VEGVFTLTSKKQKTTYANLTKKQMTALPMFVDPSITSIKAIAEKCGVARSTIYDWLDDEEFKKAVDRKIDSYTDSQEANIWKSLIKRAKDGNVRAIKLYFEMKNKYKDRKEVTGNNGEPIEVEYDLSGLSDEELIALEEVNRKIEGS